jgi:hypothetical protein
LKSLNKVFHGQWTVGNEEQAVVFGQRAGLDENPRKLDEEIDYLRLQRRELGGWRPMHAVLGHLFFHEQLYYWLDLY